MLAVVEWKISSLETDSAAASDGYTDIRGGKELKWHCVAHGGGHNIDSATTMLETERIDD